MRSLRGALRHFTGDRHLAGPQATDRMRLLRFIADAPSPVDINDMCRGTGLGPDHVPPALAGLEEDGCVEFSVEQPPLLGRHPRRLFAVTPRGRGELDSA